MLPQLVSRILHPNAKLSEKLKQILLRVLQHYPHHGFWAMASGAKSNGVKRSAANMETLEKAKVRRRLPLLVHLVLTAFHSLSPCTRRATDRARTRLS